MSRKLYAAFAPLMVMAAVAAVPALAQAQPHWYVNGTRLPFENAKKEVKKTAVTSHGTLTLTDATLNAKVTCNATDKGNIWNTKSTESGKDEITEFTNSECDGNICPEKSTTEVIAEGVPWATELTEAVGGEPRVKITGIAISIRCSTVVAAVYTGSLEPKWSNDSPSYAEFDAKSGHLTNSSTDTEGVVTGKDVIEGPSGEVVEVRNP